jgi:hypothetical protein
MLEKRIEQMVEQFLIPPQWKGKISVLPSSGSYCAESCLNHVLTKWPFSECVLFQAVRASTGEIWTSAHSFVRVGSAFRPVVLFESLEECRNLSRNDIICMLCSLIREIETELDLLRQEGVEFAASDDILTSF